jgi:hypothetical protein
MSRFHAPDDSVTEQSVRMAFNYEYMVPIEVSWELERELNSLREECQVTDLVWTMKWLKRLSHELNRMQGSGHHPSTATFLSELNERRKGSVALNGVGREVGL